MGASNVQEVPHKNCPLDKTIFCLRLYLTTIEFTHFHSTIASDSMSVSVCVCKHVNSLWLYSCQDVEMGVNHVHSNASKLW